MTTKTCTKCEVEKDIDKFCKRRDRKDGYNTICKDCDNQKSRQYYTDNRERVLKRCRKYNLEHAEETKEQRSAYGKIYNKKYCQKPDIKQRRKISHQNRIKNNPLIKDSHRLSGYLRRSLKTIGSRKDNVFFKLVGYSKSELDNRFTPMRNSPCPMCRRSLEDGYHIDHILPVSCAKNREELIKLFKLSNLQLLCPSCNLSKSNKIPKEDTVACSNGACLI